MITGNGEFAEKFSESKSGVRVRHTFQRTQRDGWRFEDSIEVLRPGLDEEAMQDLLAKLQTLTDASREHGFRECALRNEMDGRE